MSKLTVIARFYTIILTGYGHPIMKLTPEQHEACQHNLASNRDFR